MELDGAVEHADVRLVRVLSFEEVVHPECGVACDDGSDAGFELKDADLVAGDGEGQLIDREVVGPLDVGQDALGVQACRRVAVRAVCGHHAGGLEAALVEELRREGEVVHEAAPAGRGLLHGVLSAVHAGLVALDL